MSAALCTGLSFLEFSMSEISSTVFTPSIYASCPHLPSSCTHECHVCKLPVPPQLPVNKRDTRTHTQSFPPKYCSDIVGEVVPSEGESVGGLEERRSGSHVGVLPLTVSGPCLPGSLPDLSAAWLSRLSIPARPDEPRLSDPTRTTFLSYNTTHNTAAVSRRHKLGLLSCCIGQTLADIWYRISALQSRYPDCC